MIKKFIPVNEPLIGNLEIEYVQDCLKTGWISSEGPYVNRFEKDFCKFIGHKFGISVSSGSAALDVVFKALNLPKGSEVILPSFTIISCASSIYKCDLKPVPVDCDLHTFNSSPSHILEKITDNTSAILLVHIYGLSVDIGPILECCNKRGLYLIEDCAEAIGLKYKEELCGSYAHASVFSFYPNKNITTGEGGMITTNSEEIAERCSSFRNLCFQPENRFVHEEIGWNYRLSNIHAALGCAQLQRIDITLEKKRSIGRYYSEKLEYLSEYFHLPLPYANHSENCYWVFTIVLKKGKANDLSNFLRSYGIGTRPFFFPIHKQPIFLKNDLFDKTFLPNCEKLYETGLYIPSGLTLTREDQDYVISILDKYVIQL